MRKLLSYQDSYRLHLVLSSLICASVISGLVQYHVKKEKKIAKKFVLRKLQKKGEGSDCWYAQVLNLHIKLCNQLYSFGAILLVDSI